jgi:hypothetical protein
MSILSFVDAPHVVTAAEPNITSSGLSFGTALFEG